jgi:hypothetical protein
MINERAGNTRTSFDPRMDLPLLPLVLIPDLEPPQTRLHCIYAIADVDFEMTVAIVDVASGKEHRELVTGKNTGSIRLGNADPVAPVAVRITKT